MSSFDGLFQHATRQARAQQAAVTARQAAIAQAKRGDQERRRDESVIQPLRAEFVVDLSGPGEATLLVKFPFTFFEKPLIAQGGLELVGSARPAEGSFPMFTVFVMEWVTRPKNKSEFLYTGARVGLKVTGDAALKFKAHFAFETKASPVGAAPMSTDDVV